MQWSSEGKLQRETEAARAVLARLREELGADDPILASDMVEGETNLFEAIDAVLSEIDECEVFVHGLKEKEGQFGSRRRATEERIKRLRAMIEQAMAIADQRKIRRPSATLSLRQLAPDVIVVSEPDIPAAYFIPQPPPPPKLDKAALREALLLREEKIEWAASLSDPLERKEALASIEEIPGAVLSNGGFSLQVRRS
jgi:hypothetical protein